MYSKVSAFLLAQAYLGLAVLLFSSVEAVPPLTPLAAGEIYPHTFNANRIFQKSMRPTAALCLPRDEIQVCFWYFWGYYMHKKICFKISEDETFEDGLFQVPLLCLPCQLIHKLGTLHSLQRRGGSPSIGKVGHCTALSLGNRTCGFLYMILFISKVSLTSTVCFRF